MQPTLLPTQFLSSAIGAIMGPLAEVEQGRTKLRALEVQLSHDREMYGMKTDFMRGLIRSLIDRRVDAVQKGFQDVLAMYAEQARHYMAQQEKYADAEIKASTPMEQAGIGKRISEINIQLENIRADAAMLYREMLRAILLIGGTMPTMAAQDQRALAIAA
jgi:hypothetical protein